MSTNHSEPETELKPFLIGTVNIYDYQAEGFHRWSTYQAAETEVILTACSSVELFKELIPGLQAITN